MKRKLNWVQHHAFASLVRFNLSTTYDDGKTHGHDEETDDPEIVRAMQKVERLIAAKVGAVLEDPYDAAPPMTIRAKKKSNTKPSKKGARRAAR